ncbi:MAG: hypothetical protein K9L68_05225, partial [Spirochaetales bacterium]|nr:hypothetical protein [Spirochaetales bacterium]MCF7937981.1 hypothetical protein [Spirochaetales bacterium]
MCSSGPGRRHGLPLAALVPVGDPGCRLQLWSRSDPRLPCAALVPVGDPGCRVQLWSRAETQAAGRPARVVRPGLPCAALVRVGDPGCRVQL